MSTLEAAIFLKDYFVPLSVSRILKHFNGITFHAVDVQSYNEGSVMGEQISMIMLWDEIGSVILKTYFDLDIARQITTDALNCSIDTVPDEMVRAYKNEYNNLMGGFFRGILDEQNVLIGMSLPYTTSGKHELCFLWFVTIDMYADNRYVFRKWKVKNEKSYSFHCTSEISLVNSDVLIKHKQNLNNYLAYNFNTNGGDIGF